MDEARHCDRVIMINEGRIVAGGSPCDIIRQVLPDRPDADLDTAFVKLMARRKT
jgi:ABC-2 type transport system ATP-binding protein